MPRRPRLHVPLPARTKTGIKEKEQTMDSLIHTLAPMLGVSFGTFLLVLAVPQLVRALRTPKRTGHTAEHRLVPVQHVGSTEEYGTGYVQPVEDELGGY